MMSKLNKSLIIPSMEVSRNGNLYQQQNFFENDKITQKTYQSNMNLMNKNNSFDKT
jgi:hypothetical protein